MWFEKVAEKREHVRKPWNQLKFEKLKIAQKYNYSITCFQTIDVVELINKYNNIINKTNILVLNKNKE